MIESSPKSAPGAKPKTRSRSLRRKWLPAIAAFLAGVAVTALMVASFGRGEEVFPWLSSRDPVVRLARSATASHRPTLARLSGFAFAAQPSALRGADERPNVAVLAGAAEIQQLASADPSPPNLHALAIAHLFLGEIDRALDLLTSSPLASGNSIYSNDLAVALLEKAVRDEKPARAAEALEILSGLDPTVENAFNQALAMELLGLGDEAAVAWERYLSLDPDSPWSNEGRERSARLRAEAASAPPLSAQDVERDLLERLMPQWAEAELEGNSTRAHFLLGEARTIALEFAALHHDEALVEVVNLAAHGDSTRRSQIASRLRAFERARRSYSREEAGECVRSATAAIVGRREGADALGMLAELTAASCEFLRGDLPRAAALAAAVSNSVRAGAAPMPTVSGRAEWIQALTAYYRRPLDALTGYREALRAFEVANDPFRAAAVRGLLADILEYLGRRDEAWSVLVAATRTLQFRAERRFQLLASLNGLAVRSRLPRVALRAAEAAEHVARISSPTSWASEAQVLIGETRLRLGDSVGAISAFRTAIERAEGIADPGPRARALDLARLQLVRELISPDLDEAEGLLASITPLAERDFYLEVALARASVRRLRGETAGAETALRTALARSSLEQAEIRGRGERDALLARRADLYLALLDLLLSENREAEALSVVDQWRSDPLPGRSSSPPESSALSGLEPPRVISEGTGVYSFLSLADELLVWRVDAHGTRFARRALGRAELERRVREQVDAISRGAEPDAGLDLGPLLFADLSPLAGEKLVIVPDPVLYALPFSALSLRVGGLPLVVEHEISVAPSIALWSRPVSSPSSAEARCALLVEGASSGGELFPELPTLGRLSDELQAVAKSYRCVRRAASAADFARLLDARVEVVHFAGHSVVGSGEGGFLVLQHGSKVVPVGTEALAGWRLGGATVVLSSCSSAEGRSSPSVGRDGLAYGFLASGAAAVVASLWPIEDEAAFEFSTLLHELLARGEPASRALRRAQLALIEKGRPARTWAGWLALGSG